MLPLAGMLFNVVAGLVVDKAQDLAEEHVEKMINDILPDNAKKELDKIIKSDTSHTFNNAKDALKGASNRPPDSLDFSVGFLMMGGGPSMKVLNTLLASAK